MQRNQRYFILVKTQRLSKMQLDRQLLGFRFECVMLVAASLACSSDEDIFLFFSHL